MSPFNVARTYIADGIADYEFELLKSQALVCLYNYRATGKDAYLAQAIRATQIALFIRRLQRVS